MRLVHYSKERLAKFNDSVPIQPFHETSYQKPKGLWVSVEGNGDGWLDWITSEGFHVDEYTVETEISLVDKEAILVLTSPTDLDEFTRKYSVHTPYGKAINWIQVAHSYKGIIIAPYIWERRMELNWYYGWDCASGCIWDTSCLSIVQELEPA